MYKKTLLILLIVFCTAMLQKEIAYADREVEDINGSEDLGNLEEEYCLSDMPDDTGALEEVEYGSSDVPDDARYGQVLLKANVHASIDDLDYTVYVNCLNTDLNYMETVYIDKINDYERLVRLPVGQYIFENAGVAEDYKDTYPVKGISFVIEEDLLTNVEFDVGDLTEPSYFEDKTVPENNVDNNDNDNENNTGSDKEVIVIKQEQDVKDRDTSEKPQEESTSGFIGFLKNNILIISLISALSIALLVIYIKKNM